jgi:sugar-specific transcriptional regulator TrmB
MKASMSKKVGSLSKSEEGFLRRLGLSDHEIQTYQIAMASKRPITAQDVASQLMVYPSAVYRMFEHLESVGLIKRVAKRPRSYQANDRSMGYGLAYQSEVDHLKLLLEKTGYVSSSSGSKTYLVAGRQAVYDEYIRYAKTAEHEISVYAIGIAYSPELYEVQRDAIKRGVYIRHVVQRVQPSNYHIINKWQRLGVNLKHLKEEQGYHIVVIDRQIALITFSDKENTEDRLTLVTKNPVAVRLFQAQFESLWQISSKTMAK